MRDTSLQAYQQLNHISAKQADVLICIHGNPDCTDKQISTLLGWPINCVTGRRNELEKAGLIKSSGYTLQNGRRCHTWRCNQQ